MFKPIFFLLGLTALQGLAALPASGDPTRPPAAVAIVAGSVPATVTQWRLESVIMAPDSRRAVINGQRVREGDALGNGRVLAIDAGGVWVRIEGERRRLRMHRALDKNWINRDRK